LWLDDTRVVTTTRRRYEQQ
jgi:hypothetical protein